MNQREAAEIVAILRTTGLSVDDVTIRVWYESALRDVDPLEGRRVAMAMVANSSDYPTPARFNKMRRELRTVAQLPEREPFQALPPPVPDSEQIRAHMTEIREKLKNANGPLTSGLRTALNDTRRKAAQ